jgi:hypothetical protein
MDFNKERDFYITHVVVTNPSEEGFDQLFYYTVKDKTLKEGKFYWGRGNNHFNQVFMNNLMRQKKILKLNTKEYPFPIKEDETLWFDKTGAVFKASLVNPLINQKKICTLEALAKK